MSKIVIKGDKVTEINEQYRGGRGQVSDLELQVGVDGKSSDYILCGKTNMVICKLDDISEMLKDLVILKQIIEEQTGLVL